VKKILPASWTAFIVLLTIGLVASALFSDHENINNNTFAAGTLTLRLSDDNETQQDNITATWTGSDLKPGATISAVLNIRNTGSIPADHVEINTNNSVVEAASGEGVIDSVKMDTVLEISRFTWDSNDILTSVSDINGNGIKDLDDLESQTLDSLSHTSLDTDVPLIMTVRFHPSLTLSQHQGDSVSTSFTISLNQHSSQ
jgi:predicted ribosomally synthesized peptide with SipW-like signal peptide